jgi:ABC-type glycerol-3-phosphate transport system permease component
MNVTSTRRFGRGGRTASTIPNYLILTLLAIFVIGPLLLLLSNSFRTTPEIAAAPFSPPTELHFDNYSKAWTQGNYSITVRNTVVIAAGTILGVVLMGGLAAYSLARLDRRSRTPSPSIW